MMAVLDAAASCLSRDPDASVTDIARAAGVGRVTVYGHFPSRADLVDAVVGHAMQLADVALEVEDFEHGAAPDALERLIRSSWRQLERQRRLLPVAHRYLSPSRIRAHHDPALARVERLIARGRQDATFRTDLSCGWLVAVFYSVLHSAAEEVDAGRLDPDTAADALAATLRSAFAPPPRRDALPARRAAP